MKFNSTFNKIRKVFSQVLNNDNNLEKKSIIFEKNKFNTDLFKTPKLLYDSGWLNASSIQEDLNSLYIELTYDYATATKNQETPFILSYIFTNILNISENDLPFIDTLVSFKKYPDVTINALRLLPYDEYDDDPYWKILGDSTKIYEGYYPTKRFFSEQDKANGDFLVNNASKWFYGTLKYTIDDDNYELQSSYIVSVITNYDVVEIEGHPGLYNYKSFTTPAIDNISGSTINGEGTYQIVTPPDTITTKNVQMSAPMFEDRTIIHASGFLYKNGVYKSYYSDLTPLTIDFEGELGGNATLVDFDYAWSDEWNLFWDNNRARQFRFNESVRIPQNLPQNYDYETTDLPYTKIYVYENPSGFPEIIDGRSNYGRCTEKKIWIKKNDNQYQLLLNGNLFLSAPADNEKITYVAFVGEEYSQSGTTYLRDSENRDNQQKPIYEPSADGIQLRLQIFYNNSLNYDTTIKVENK